MGLINSLERSDLTLDLDFRSYLFEEWNRKNK